MIKVFYHLIGKRNCYYLEGLCCLHEKYRSILPDDIDVWIEGKHIYFHYEFGDEVVYALLHTTIHEFDWLLTRKWFSKPVTCSVWTQIADAFGYAVFTEENNRIVFNKLDITPSAFI